MKKDIHPENYRLVVFQDMSNDYKFITKSTVETKDTIKWEDGNEYPLVKLEISHKSHPFYTGKMKLVDTAGRVDKFKSRYKKQVDKKNTPVEAKEETPAPEVKEEVKAEAPVEAQVEETPIEEAPVEEIVAEEASTEETPVEEAPAEEAATEETPVEEAPVEAKEEAPVEDEAAGDDAPAEESSEEEKSE